MNEETKEYLKRVDELELKLTGEDKETYQWVLFGYNECARLLNEAEQENQSLKKQQKEFVKYLEEEKNRLIKETSNYYIDSFDRQHAVNETVYDEVNDILTKYKEIIEVE